MTTEQFAYWLQGYSEVCGKVPNPTQWLIIQDHLNLVFDKKTPERKHPLREVVEKFGIPKPSEQTYCASVAPVVPFRACGDASLRISGLDKEGREVYARDISLEVPATTC